MCFGLHLLADNNAVNVVTVGMNLVQFLSTVSQFGGGPGAVNCISQKALFSTYTVGECVVVEELCVSIELHCLTENNIANVVSVGMDFVKGLSTVSQCVEGFGTVNFPSKRARALLVVQTRKRCFQRIPTLSGLRWTVLVHRATL